MFVNIEKKCVLLTYQNKSLSFNVFVQKFIFHSIVFSAFAVHSHINALQQKQKKYYLIGNFFWKAFIYVRLVAEMWVAALCIAKLKKRKQFITFIFSLTLVYVYFLCMFTRLLDNVILRIHICYFNYYFILVFTPMNESNV